MRTDQHSSSRLLRTRGSDDSRRESRSTRDEGVIKRECTNVGLLEAFLQREVLVPELDHHGALVVELGFHLQESVEERERKGGVSACSLDSPQAKAGRKEEGRKGREKAKKTMERESSEAFGRTCRIFLARSSRAASLLGGVMVPDFSWMPICSSRRKGGRRRESASRSREGTKPRHEERSEFT